MKCKDLQFILPLYSDDVLSESEQKLAAQHLDSCPVCRQKLVDFQEIKNNLRSVRKPHFPAAAAGVLKRNIALRLAASDPRPMFQAVGESRRWLDVWLMPMTVGSLSTLVFGFTLLWVIVSSEIQPDGRISASRPAVNTTILYPYSPPTVTIDTDLNPFDYANSRAGFSQESPSINPRGSLVALTRDLINEVSDNDEVTVVADVYGNGSASIAQVVEPSSDSRAVDELERALGSDPSAAAFVPASFDQRSEPMRVVLKFQSVSVNTKLR